jgi:hypothetical protein
MQYQQCYKSDPTSMQYQPTQNHGIDETKDMALCIGCVSFQDLLSSTPRAETQPGLVLPNAVFLVILLSLCNTRLQGNPISNLILSLSLSKSLSLSLSTSLSLSPIKVYLYLKIELEFESNYLQDLN